MRMKPVIFLAANGTYIKAFVGNGLKIVMHLAVFLPANETYITAFAGNGFKIVILVLLFSTNRAFLLTFARHGLKGMNFIPLFSATGAFAKIPFVTQYFTKYIHFIPLEIHRPRSGSTFVILNLNFRLVPACGLFCVPYV
jgi:hypothetical protein